jgi:DNA (cytosine-5)-methyltransferase 1
MGYAKAGFEVVGVDIDPQPRYPFRFIQTDALTLDAEFLAGFDAIHASPPCQFATLLRHAPGGKVHPNLIPATRDLLERTGLPFIIENVEPARGHLRAPLLLCGSMFGLGAQGHEMRRHRLFESNVPLVAPGPCKHGDGPVVGIYGGHARRRSAKHGGRGTKDAWEGGHRGAAVQAMGMEWATLGGMSEAIPPAYTEFLGKQLLAVCGNKGGGAQ